MSKSHFIPRSEYEFQAWFDHFVNSVSPAHGISDASLTNLKALNDGFRSKMVAADNAAALAKQTVADKKAHRERAMDAIRAEVRRIKAHADYNESIGQQWVSRVPMSAAILKTRRRF